MKTTTTNEVDTNVTLSDEGTWRANISGALEFPGSNAEYCRRNGLDYQIFRSYKKKFGAKKSRILAPKAFVKIETEMLKVPRSAAPLRLRHGALPDPRWTADFIAALMDARQ